MDAYQKTEVWWLIEMNSPPAYISDLSTSLQMTANPWRALKFLTKEMAEEALSKSSYGGSPGWIITEHLFYL